MTTLKSLATARGMFIGAEVITGGAFLNSSNSFFSDLTYRAAHATELNVVGPQNGAQFGVIESPQSTFNLSSLTDVASFCTTNNMLMWVPQMIWEAAEPAWLTGGSFTSVQAQQVMQNHINNITSPVSSVVSWWCVVNEPLKFDGSFTTTAGGFSTRIGVPMYIDNAFTFARAALPANVKLVLNENNIEFPGPKADAFVSLVTGMQARGVPIDAVGFQFHYPLNAPSADIIRTQVQRYTALGLKVHFSESEVRLSSSVTGALYTYARTQQAKVYNDLMDVALTEPGVEYVQLMRLTTLYSAITQTYPGYGYEAPLDNSLVHTPVWDALATRLAAFPPHQPSSIRFYSGLENEDGSFSEEWKGTTVASGNSVSVQSSVVYAGTNAGQITYAGTSGLATANRTIYEAPSELWVRGRFQINGAFTGGADSQNVILLDFKDQALNERALVKITCGTTAGGTRGSWAWNVHLGNPFTQIYLGSVGEITKDVWHKVEFHWKAGSGANGGMQVWIDDVSKGSNFALNLAGTQLATMTVGNPNSVAGPTAGSNLYFDDIDLAYDTGSEAWAYPQFARSMLLFPPNARPIPVLTGDKRSDTNPAIDTVRGT